MLDLDKYINDTIEVKIYGHVIRVKEPTMHMYGELTTLEKDMDNDNFADKRVKTALMFINNNCEGEIFTEEQIKLLPYIATETIAKEIAAMRERVEMDPNSKSPSPKAK